MIDDEQQQCIELCLGYGEVAPKPRTHSVTHWLRTSRQLCLQSTQASYQSTQMILRVLPIGVREAVTTPQAARFCHNKAQLRHRQV